MKKTKGYAPRLPEYEAESEWEEDKTIAFYREMKGLKKRPTSVALEQGTIDELKKLAGRQQVPYQVLMRLFIQEGLSKAQGSRSGSASVVRDAGGEKPFTIPARFIRASGYPSEETNARELTRLILDLKDLIRELNLLAARLRARKR